MKFIHLSCLKFIFPIIFVTGQQPEIETFAFSDQISALKLKSAAHEKEIAKLLSSSELKPTNFVVPTTPNSLPQPPDFKPEVPPAPYLPVPDYFKVKETSDVPAPAVPPDKEDNPYAEEYAIRESGVDLNGSSTVIEDKSSSVPKTVFARHEGYYFGPLLGFTMPDDGAVRDAGVAGTGKIPYESDIGYFLGLQFGKDFGTVRWEVEYSHQGFDAEGLNHGFEVGIHSFVTRLLLEKEIGDLFDLRAGLGTGVGFITLESNQDFSGESFIYDFAIGANYRFSEKMSLALDYRFFLSAAEDKYDRINSHIFTATAYFDL